MVRCRGTFCLFWLFCTVIFSVVLLCVLPTVLQLKSFSKSDSSVSESKLSLSQYDFHFFYGDPPSQESQLTHELSELRRVRASVLRELVILEKNRNRLVAASRQLSARLNEQRRQEVLLKAEQHRLRLAIHSLQQHQAEVELNNLPVLRAPLPLAPALRPVVPLSASVAAAVDSDNGCDMHSCFSVHNCSLAHPFKVRYWNVPRALKNIVDNCPYTATRQAEPVCLQVYFDQAEAASSSPAQSLNHFVYITSTHSHQSRMSPNVILASPDVRRSHFRVGFDMIVAPLPLSSEKEPLWRRLEPLLPARRHYLLHFQGRLGAPTVTAAAAAKRYYAPVVRELVSAASSSARADVFLLDWHCGGVGAFNISSANWTQAPLVEWLPCGSAAQRHASLRRATFALLLSPADPLQLSTSAVQNRLMEALFAGAVPVLLGQATPALEELLPWRGVLLRLATGRVSELHFLLRSVPDSDLVEMRRRGRLLLERYLGTAHLQLQSFLAVMRQRLSMPAAPILDTPSHSAFRPGFQPMLVPVANINNQLDDYLGPVDGGAIWPAYQRNFTASMLSSPLRPMPFRRFSFDPWAPGLPTEAAQAGGGPAGSSYGFRPLEHSLNTAGVEFSHSLGGNRPHERFTVVLLSYRRPQVLLNTLEKLKGLAYLHSVVIVWNVVGERPDPELHWPDIGVKVHVRTRPPHGLIVCCMSVSCLGSLCSEKQSQQSFFAVRRDQN